MGLLELFKTEGKKFLNDSFGGILNPEWTPERAKTAGSLLLDMTPVVGDIKSGYEGIQAAKQGDYLGAGLGALGALPLVPNMAGMFIGKGAKTWDAVKASQAMDMEKAGVDPRKIWSETGNWKGPDGHWRQEIPDNSAVLIESRLPKAKGRLEIANEYLHSQGVKPTLDVASSDSLVSPMLKQEALQYADMKVSKGAPEIPLSDAMFHPNLFNTYQSLGDLSIARDISGKAGLRGTFDPSAGKITISGGDLTSTSRDLSSTAIHELQHAIQGKEGWAKGGSPDDIRTLLPAIKRNEMMPVYSGNNAYDYHIGQWGEANRAGYLKKLDGIIGKENPKPSDISNMSDWYSYSDKIREMLGPMPKQATAARDEWIRSAAAFIKNKALEESSYGAKSLLEREAKDIKRIADKSYRTAQKYKDDAMAARKIEDKYKTVSAMSDHEIYKRLAGEAEARATQARMNMDMAERLRTFPADSYDVPLDQLIIRGLLNP